jgi:hypothetical protein
VVTVLKGLIDWIHVSVPSGLRLIGGDATAGGTGLAAQSELPDKTLVAVRILALEIIE